MRAQATGKPGGAAQTQRLMQFGSSAKGLFLEAQFREETTRATWDFPINMNLTQCAGIRVTLCAETVSNVRQMDVHLKFGTKWYTATFECSSPGRWEEIIIPRHWFQPEEGSTSWSHCDTLRISLWKGTRGPAKLRVASLRFISPNASVAILCGGDSAKSFKEHLKYPRMLAEALCKNGLFPAVFEEADQATSTLASYKLLLLPSGDGLTSQQIQTLSWYIRQGGKIAAFYTVPSMLAEQLDIPSGKFQRTSELSQGIVGVLPDSNYLPNARPFQQGSGCFLAVSRLPVTSHVAAWWMNSQGKPTSNPAVIESPKGFWMTHVFLNQDSRNGGQFFIRLFSRILPNLHQTTTKELLRQTETAWRFANESMHEQASAQKAKADKAWKEGQWSQASSVLWELREILKAPTHKKSASNKNEIRAIYCRYPDGLSGLKWSGTLQKLKTAGFNLVLPYAGAPYEPAVPLPQVGRQLPNADLTACVQEAHAHNIRVVAWLNCLDLSDAPEALITKWKAEQRLQCNDRKQTLKWLCPNNPANRTLLKQLVSETLRTYGFDGIQFDRIRYPSTSGCFCPTCRKAFEKSIGSPIPDWPNAVLPQGKRHAQWLEFRTKTISALLAELCNTALATKPTCLLSAAVYPDWDSARTNVGQDWVSWCRNRWLSFATPMNYHDSANQYLATLQRQIRQTKAPNRLVPAIGFSVHKLSQHALNAQINANRLENPAGFVLFDLAPAEIPQIPL